MIRLHNWSTFTFRTVSVLIFLFEIQMVSNSVKCYAQTDTDIHDHGCECVYAAGYPTWYNIHNIHVTYMLIFLVVHLTSP